MKNYIVFLTLLISCAIVVRGSILNFSTMIRQMTGKNAFPSYSGYGCHCGIGGRAAPKDATDWCCFRHDCCYDRLERRGCKPKSDAYRHSYRNGEVRCVSGSRCGLQACGCDKIATTCFRRNVRSYNSRLTYQLNFLCTGREPSC